MTDWADRLAGPFEAVRHGIDAAGPQFASTHGGPLTFDRIDYPAAQTYLDEFARTGTTDWQFTITAAMYFEWSRDMDFVPDILHPVASVLDESLTALGEVGCINDYHVNRINFFSGEPGNSLVLAVTADFQCTTLLDPGEF
jgi:hypothetical protein